MSERTRILFVAPVEPWCRENGSSLITADLVDALSTVDDIDLLAVFVRRPPPGYDRQPPEHLRQVLLDIPGLPRWVSVMRAAARRSTPLRHRFANTRVARRILDVLAEQGFEPDLVHVEHLPLVDIGLEVSAAHHAPLVYRAHNVESSLWARRLGEPNRLKEAVIRHMEGQEGDAITSADLTLCISEGDLDWARARAPEARCELLPCTLRLERYSNRRRVASPTEGQMCFVGGLDWAPNEDGLRWFVTEVLPIITRDDPSAFLAVLARGASERPWLRDDPSVRILSPESRALDLFASSRVSIAPLFQAGGVRIKIPESLASGCPVVATRIGAEGHDLAGLVQVDEPEAFARACLDYLGRDGAAGVTDGLRHEVESRYGAGTQASRLVGLWSEVIEGHRPAR